MNIKEVKTCFKVADVVLEPIHPKNFIKFNYIENIFDENGQKLDNKILRKRVGFVYIIVINKIIKKIGGSQGKGGIKSTMNFYQGAMQGGPSIRSFGIHLLIKKELDEGKKVEFYVIVSKEIKTEIKGLFGSEKGFVVAYKEMEEKCNEDYFSVEHKYPDWHFQSRGRGAGYRWPEWVRKSYEKYRVQNAKKAKKKSKKV
ncbi:MAG: type II restriction endonuclease [Candidatus Staskawiczbacteria bacterium]|nr:type II restriction endonuclease [Candidatus Staskawiczbacteria bacterium]